MAGLDPVLGFTRRTAEEINDQLAADEIAGLSPALDVSSTSPVGQINSAHAKIASEVWDALEAVYDSRDPDKATGDALDALCALTGTTRLPALRSQVRCTLGLGVGATIPVGALIAVLGAPSIQFRFVGEEPIVGTVSAGTLTAVTAGTYYGRFEGSATGPLVANAGTMTRIVTPQSGWASVYNALDAVPGRLAESDTSLRIRREVEIAAAGSTPVDALRSELSQLLAASLVDGFVDVVENELDTTDGAGRPGHSVEAVIDDGVTPLPNNTIAQTIWEGKAGGIQAYGTSTGNAVDDLGVTRAMKFTRPTLVPVYFNIGVVIDPTVFPADGDVQIRQGVVALGKTLKPGDDAVRNAFFAPIFQVAGVKNVTILNLGFAPAPGGSADLVIAVRERASFDTSYVAVGHV